MRVDRRVRAMRGAEGVVDVDVGQRRELPSRTPRRSSPPPGGTADSRAARRRRRGAPATACSAAGPTQSSAKITGRFSSSASACGDRPQAHLRIRLALRPSEVRRQDDDARAVVQCVGDRRQRRGDAGVVADHAVLERHVEVDADEDALAGDVEVANRAVWSRVRHGVARTGALGSESCSGYVRDERERSYRPAATSLRSRSTQRLE